MRLIIYFLLFFVFNTAFGQQKHEMSEEEFVLLKSKIRLHFNANIDSSIVYAYKMAQSNNYKHLAFATGALSCFMQMKGETQKSKEKFKKALTYLQKVPDSRDKIQLTADLFNYEGLSEYNRSNLSAALQKFQEGIKLSEQINDISQIIKFKVNITLINQKVGNHQLAIKNLKELDRFINKNEDLLAKDDVLNRRSNINLGLGNSYEDYFTENKNRKEFLDSAAYYYKKTIYYSDIFSDTKATALISLGNILYWKHDYKNAEKKYLEVVSLTKKENQLDLLCTANYNLGDIYYTSKRYDKALLHFKISDSLSLKTNLNKLDYLKSNYYQARIYNELNKPELAHKYSKIYLEEYEKFQTKLREETVEVNYKQGLDDLTAEMVSVQKKYKRELLLNKGLNILYVLLVLGFVILLIKNIRSKKKVHKKVNALIEEFKTNIENENRLVSKKKILNPKGIKINIKEIEENRIIQELLILQNKQEYLSNDFTLPYAAKKIKTNTTYLSYVVNKRFGKSFGEYTNELKINYVINELITNQTYRKYSTQAAAESAGFKNRGSFAKSFRKRTGVSPAQFANNI